VLCPQVILDKIKDQKASLQNDFSRYKRSFTSIRADLRESDAISDENHNLQMFLGNPQHPHNLILFNLKEQVQKLTTLIPPNNTNNPNKNNPNIPHRCRS
jgi:hypothetical protein